MDHKRYIIYIVMWIDVEPMSGRKVGLVDIIFNFFDYILFVSQQPDEELGIWPLDPDILL